MGAPPARERGGRGALALAAELVDGLQVDAERMRANVDAQRGYVLAEPAMLALAAQVGKRRAHELVRAASLRGRERGCDARGGAGRRPPSRGGAAAWTELAALLRAEPALDAREIDRVGARGRRR